MAYEQIVTEVVDRVGVLRLNRPEKLNAWTSQMAAEIQDQMNSWNDDSDIGAILVTGEGRAFCAGADIKARAEAVASGTKTDHGRAAREAFNAIYDCPLPVIGAVNGPALGAGISLAASCDYLIASEKAVFGLPEIDVGLMGGARHLARLFPQSLVRRMLFTAERLSANEAYRLGAVVRVGGD